MRVLVAFELFYVGAGAVAQHAIFSAAVLIVTGLFVCLEDPR